MYNNLHIQQDNDAFKQSIIKEVKTIVEQLNANFKLVDEKLDKFDSRSTKVLEKVDLLSTKMAIQEETTSDLVDTSNTQYACINHVANVQNSRKELFDRLEVLLDILQPNETNPTNPKAPNTTTKATTTKGKC